MTYKQRYRGFAGEQPRITREQPQDEVEEADDAEGGPEALPVHSGGEEGSGDSPPPPEGAPSEEEPPLDG
jgi:hypothetical protein